NFVPDAKCVADPGILNKAVLPRGGLHHDVGTKPPDLEAPSWIELPEPVEGRRRQQMDTGTVEKCPRWQSDIGDGVPVVEAVHIRPILLGMGGLRGAALARSQCHLTVKRLGQDFVDLALLAGGEGA